VIRYLIVLYLGLVSIILVDPNPLFATPLLLVLASFMFGKRWIGVLGILGYSLITIGRLGGIDLTDIWSLLLHTVLVMIPLVVLLEIVISPSPYRLERISIAPMILSLGMGAGMLLVLFLLSRVQRIGVYLNSDPVLQVFILMALSIFFFGPPLLGTGRVARLSSNDTSDHS
jgi:hypothetical protein